MNSSAFGKVPKPYSMSPAFPIATTCNTVRARACYYFVPLWRLVVVQRSDDILYPAPFLTEDCLSFLPCFFLSI